MRFEIANREAIIGIGDELLAAGLARGAHERGEKIAFGNERRIIWSKNAHEIFRGNPNVARPGEERLAGLRWIVHHSGNRIYQKHDPKHDRFLWNYDFRARPGEVFFTPAEQCYSVGSGYIVVEPNVLTRKPSSVNKTWHGYQQVVTALRLAGHRVVQFNYGERHRLIGADIYDTASMRQAMVLLSRAVLFIGPEGGMHHAAAAVGVPGVVIFGGFAPPEVLGYDTHVNLTGGVAACGSRRKCSHCEQALRKITVEEVIHHSHAILSKAEQNVA